MQIPEEVGGGNGPPRAGVTNGYEQPDVGAGNGLTLEEQSVPLTTGPSRHPLQIS